MNVFFNYSEVKAQNQYNGFDKYDANIILEHAPDLTSELIPDESLSDSDSVQVSENKIISFDLAIDSEFIAYSNKTSDPISVQGVFIYKKKSLKLIVINSKYAPDIPASVLDEISQKQNVEIYYDSFLDKSDPVLLTYFYKHYDQNPDYWGFDIISKKRIHFNLFMYYSLKDLTFSFGYNNLKPYYTGSQKSITQNRNISGNFQINYDTRIHSFKIFDLFGYSNFGLKSLALSVNLQKYDDLDNYKTQMNKALIEKTDLFVKYAMNDAEILPEIFTRKIKSFNDILNVLNVTHPDAKFTKTNTPLTIGSVVHKIFTKYIRYAVLKGNDAIYLSILKQGILNNSHPKYDVNYEYYNQLSNISSLEELENNDSINKIYESLSKENVFNYKAWQYASVNYLISEASSNSSLPITGLTTGGRTVNERCREFLIEYGADVDISGAYGSQLQKLTFPIGRPRLFSSTSNSNKKITLGSFMKKIDKKVTSGLYKVVVEGTLSFEQDLIYSKIPPEDVSRKIIYDKEDPETAAIDAPFVLLRKEIKNGFITKANWEVLQKVCTNQELNEIKNFKVVSAVYWQDSDRVDSIEELADEFLKDKGEYKFDHQQNTIVDSRTFKWYGVSLNEFITPLMEKRKAIKKSKNPEDQALQESIKLVINTTWGLLTSPYFDINNVVCSEIVTSAIRTNVWLISKALNTHLSITDGGPYSLMHVSFLKTNIRKPSLAVLSSYYKYKNHRSIEIGPLANINWKEYFDNNVPPTEMPFLDLDKFAQEHVANFWANYKIEINVKLEHKLDNTFVKGSYFLRAHYLFKIYEKKTKSYTLYFSKIRGFRNEETIQFQNPMYKLLIHMIESKDKKFIVENNGVYFQTRILRLKSWKKTLVSKNKKKVSKLGDDIEPGDSIEIVCYFRLNNTHCHIDFLKEYKKRMNRANRYKTIYDSQGGGIVIRQPLFEKFLSYFNIDLVIERMNADNIKLTEKEIKKLTDGLSNSNN
jgi:hypothetical protein